MSEVNPFAKFDVLRDPAVLSDHSLSDTTPAAATGSNPFARFDHLRDSAATSPMSSSIGDILRQIPAGLNEGIADIAGAPVDAAEWVLKHVPGLENEEPFLGSKSIKRGLGMIGANPDDTPPRTAAERIARGAGGGIAGMLLPEAALGGLIEGGAIGGRAAEIGAQTLGRSATLGDVAKSAGVGAGAGGSSEAAAEVSPDTYKPLARVVGGLAGGGAGMLAGEAPRAVVETARAGRNFVAPMSEAGRGRLAAETLSRRAANVDEVTEALDTARREIVPGSRPTTFQLTGDMGLGSLERELQTRSPGDFMQRRAEQNAARVDALTGIQRAGEPIEVANAIKTSLRDIDTITHDAVEHVTQEARSAAEGIGGEGAPEQHGAALRSVLQDAENAARLVERSLWAEVDPEGRLTVNMAPVRKAVERVYGNLTAAARAGLSVPENTIRQVIETYQPIEPFRELSDLRSAVSSAMRHELSTGGRTQAYGRLSQLRAAVEDSIADAVQQTAKQEAQAVARGRISPEQAIEARISDWVNSFRSRQRSEVAGSDLGRDAAGRAARVARLPGATSEASFRSGSAAGHQAVSDGAPTFDAAARGRLAAATTATRERVATYNKGPVGQVLRSQGERGQYRLPDSSVAATIFKPGPVGFEGVQAFRRATDDATALATLQDYAASRLRQVATRSDGTLDPAKMANWLRAHSEAMRAFPDLAARFRDAATATSAIEDVAALRKDAMETMQRGVLGKLIGATNPDDVTRIIGGIFSQQKAVREMQQVAAEARRDPAAFEGLRKAVVDYMYGRFISNTEAATSGSSNLRSDSFQTFIREKRGVLRTVLSEREVNALSAIAADLKRANRSLSAVRIPGQSNTAQDLRPELARKAGSDHTSLLMQMILAAAGGYKVRGSAGALGGIAGVLGKHVMTRMRDAGMERVDELLKRAMLEPDVARYLLAKAPAKPGTGAVTLSLAQQLRRLSMFAPSNWKPQQTSDRKSKAETNR